MIKPMDKSVMQNHDSLDRHSVPSTVAGFDFQFQRALLELTTAENGVVVGIETLDDVAVITADGIMTLEQDKFTTDGSGRVYGDKTHNLLNTLSTWLLAVLNGDLDLKKTRFRLVTNVECTLGLVGEISGCEKKEQAQGIIKQLREMKGDSKDLKLLRRLMDKTDAEDALSKIIITTKLLDEQDDIAVKVQEALLVENAYADNRLYIYKELLGWLHDIAYGAWKDKTPFFVSKQQYINELGAIKDRLKRSRKRERPPSELHVEQTDVDELEKQMFVRQIKLVSDDDSESYEAREDYLRCLAEKVRLVEEGEILERDWTDFDMGLKDRWKRIFRREDRLRIQNASDRDVGYGIMCATLGGQDEVKLAGSPITYPYLARGSYHRLSNNREVGWHPKFEQLLKDEDYA